jgi:hypothetical protein
MAAERQTPNPGEQVAQLYEQAETEAAKAAERFVGSQGFASILGQLAENAAAMSKLTNDALDLVLRNLRVAGRRDIVRLARQLARNEDKLERVLHELEAVRDQLERGNNARGRPAPGNGGGNASASKERKAAS